MTTSTSATAVRATTSAAIAVAAATIIVVVIGIHEVTLFAPLQQILDRQTPIGGTTAATRNAVFVVVTNFVRLPNLHAVGCRASIVASSIGTRRKRGALAIHAPSTDAARTIL